MPYTLPLIILFIAISCHIHHADAMFMPKNTVMRSRSHSQPLSKSRFHSRFPTSRSSPFNTRIHPSIIPNAKHFTSNQQNDDIEAAKLRDQEEFESTHPHPPLIHPQLILDTIYSLGSQPFVMSDDKRMELVESLKLVLNETISDAVDDNNKSNKIEPCSSISTKLKCIPKLRLPVLEYEDVQRLYEVVRHFSRPSGKDVFCAILSPPRRTISMNADDQYKVVVKSRPLFVDKNDISTDGDMNPKAMVNMDAVREFEGLMRSQWIEYFNIGTYFPKVYSTYITKGDFIHRMSWRNLKSYGVDLSAGEEDLFMSGTVDGMADKINGIIPENRRNNCFRINFEMEHIPMNLYRFWNEDPRRGPGIIPFAAPILLFDYILGEYTSSKFLQLQFAEHSLPSYGVTFPTETRIIQVLGDCYMFPPSSPSLRRLEFKSWVPVTPGTVFRDTSFENQLEKMFVRGNSTQFIHAQHGSYINAIREVFGDGEKKEDSDDEYSGELKMRKISSKRVTEEEVAEVLRKYFGMWKMGEHWNKDDLIGPVKVYSMF